jgi:hypothetical protein
MLDFLLSFGDILREGALKDMENSVIVARAYGDVGINCFFGGRLK